MEYLMTYGWAILVIAVVLGVLYSLGIFNPSNFAPKAQPGSCQIFRPNGPGTNYDLNLEGTCSGELPEYVAEFSGEKNVQTTDMQNLTSFTFVGWFYEFPGNQLGTVQQSTCGITVGYAWSGCSGWACFDTCNCRLTSTHQEIGCTGYAEVSGQQNEWNMVATSVASNGLVQVYDFAGGDEYSNSYSFGQGIYAPPGNVNMGDWPGWAFTGLVSNVQVYNASLSNASLQALYDEGIGGAPIELQYLVGWWPLNGNANDYSGNNNDGNSGGTTYTGTWQNGYATS